MTSRTGIKLHFVILISVFAACTSMQTGKAPQFATESKCLQTLTSTQVPECPESKIHIPPRTYPESGIFVGYADIPSVRNFISTLAGIIGEMKEPPKLNIIVSRNDLEYSLEYLSELIRADKNQNINFIVAPSEDGFWAQDVMEVGLDQRNSTPILFDLPYDEPIMDSIPGRIAQACHFPNRKVELAPGDSKYGSGNYGGNIEVLPEVGLMVGDSMSPSLRAELLRWNNQTQIELEVNWLKTAHVDEVVSIIRDPERKAPCNYAVVHASPQMGLEILAGANLSSETRINPPIPAESGIEEKTFMTDYNPCFYSQGNLQSPTCQALVRANKTYAQIMERNLSRLRSAIREYSSCSDVRFIPLPQIYAPEGVAKNYGTHLDNAQALNPNSVNNILIGQNLILARQGISEIQKKVEEQLAPLRLKLNYVNGSYFHHLQGGLHCVTNTVRVCRNQ